MAPLFRFEPGVGSPIPCLDTSPDGAPRSADGVQYFDLESAAEKSGEGVDALRRAFESFERDLFGDTGPETAEPEQGPRFVPIDQEQPISEPPITEFKGDVRDRVRQRMAGAISPELYAAFKEQMESLGYDILRRECYPMLQLNEETKQQEVVCCATLAAVEQKVLASGFFDGWEPTRYGGVDGELKTLWLDQEPPLCAQVTLWRKGVVRPTVEIARWDQVAQYSGEGRSRKLTAFWRERPMAALEKCAKMKAMRSLFRDYVGSVYVREELAELSRRQSSSLPQASTTLSGHRNRPLPDVGESGAAVEVETVANEVDARLVMRSRGLVQDFMVDKVIQQARRERGSLEEECPEQFWAHALEIAARRYGMRR